MMPEGLLATANNRAARRFKAMLAEFFRTGTWDNPTTDLYLQADGLVVRLETEAEWESAKAELDLLITQDHDMHEQRRIVIAECDDCLTGVDEETPIQFLAGWTEAEKREVYGR